MTKSQIICLIFSYIFTFSTGALVEEHPEDKLLLFTIGLFIVGLAAFGAFIPKRKCRNPHKTDGPTMDQIIETAIDAFKWDRKKVMSWYNKENPRLNKSRPSEKVDRGLGQEVLDFLELKKNERLKNEDKK